MQIVKIHCEKCGYAWIPRVENPWKCPRCQHVPGARIRRKAVEPQPGKPDSTALGPSTTKEAEPNHE